jgi:hypothetical protein
MKCISINNVLGFIMKFSSIAALGALVGLSAANHTQTTNIE